MSGPGDDVSRSRPVALPPGVDTSKPSIARVYDYALGGKDNYEADRALFEHISAAYPEYRRFAQANRAFLVRAVTEMAQAGIDQFLDLGTGIPTSPNVHEIAREYVPDARVVYVDIDPVALAHADARLARFPGVVATPGDAREAESLLTDPVVRETLDLTRPVGLMTLAIWHFVTHDESLRALATYRAALAPGSRIALSTLHVDPARLDLIADTSDSVSTALSTDFVVRTKEQVGELFTGFSVLDPGLQDVTWWSGASSEPPLFCLAGIGELGSESR